jgi:hypothetical protein
METYFKVGDTVRVIATNPYHDWGSVTAKSVGVIRQLLPDETISTLGMKVYIDFPEQSGWKGYVGELELYYSIQDIEEALDKLSKQLEHGIPI